MSHPVLLLNCESSVLERLFNSDDADLKDFRSSLNSRKYLKIDKANRNFLFFASIFLQSREH